MLEFAHNFTGNILAVSNCRQIFTKYVKVDNIQLTRPQQSRKQNKEHQTVTEKTMADINSQATCYRSDRGSFILVAIKVKTKRIKTK